MQCFSGSPSLAPLALYAPRSFAACSTLAGQLLDPSFQLRLLPATHETRFAGGLPGSIRRPSPASQLQVRMSHTRRIVGQDDQGEERVLSRHWWPEEKRMNKAGGGPVGATDIVRFILQLSAHLDPSAAAATTHEDRGARRSASVAVVLRLSQQGRCISSDPPRICVSSR